MGKKSRLLTWVEYPNSLTSSSFTFSSLTTYLSGLPCFPQHIMLAPIPGPWLCSPHCLESSLSPSSLHNMALHDLNTPV